MSASRLEGSNRQEQGLGFATVSASHVDVLLACTTVDRSPSPMNRVGLACPLAFL